jgi:HK97 gp10 family phage protein
LDADTRQAASSYINRQASAVKGPFKPLLGDVAKDGAVRTVHANVVATKGLETSVKKNVSKTPPTEGGIRNPPWIVYKGSGNLEEAIFTEPVSSATSKSVSSAVGVDFDKAPHARHIITGTSRTPARDFLRGTLDQQQEQVKRNFTKAMKETS